MLVGYFDETGLSRKEQLCVVAGFVGNEAQWGAFASEWIPALGHHRKNLHMRKLRWNGRYIKISSDLKRLAPIAHKYNLTPVAIGVWHKDYDNFMRARIRDELTNPYIMCALMAIGAVVEEVLSPDDEVMFIFDRQEGTRAAMMDFIHKVVFQIAKLDSRVKDIDFRPHETTVCLDPADYLAFAYRENRIHKTGKKAIASAPILDCENGHGGVVHREQVRGMAEYLVSRGIIPGGKQKNISVNLAKALMKAGWSYSTIKKLSAKVDR